MHLPTMRLTNRFHIFHIIICMLMTTGVLMTTGCASTFKPSSAEQVDLSYQSMGSDRDRDFVGDLSLAENGMWTLTSEPSSASATPDDTYAQKALQEGTLVRVEEKGHEPHFFVVTKEQRWGVLLQRLDAFPFHSSALHSKGKPVDLKLLRAGMGGRMVGEGGNDKEKAEICFGNERAGSLQENRCMREHHSKRFDFYEAAEPGKLHSVSEVEEGGPGGGRQVPRAQGGIEQMVGRLPEQWVAIPHVWKGELQEARGEVKGVSRMPHGVVWIDSSCQNASHLEGSSSGARSSKKGGAEPIYDLRHVSFQDTFGDTPRFEGIFEVELAAWNTGADLFISCPKPGEAVVYLPGLARLWRTQVRGGLTREYGPFWNVFRPIAMEEEQLTIAALNAYVAQARGDFAGAAFWQLQTRYQTGEGLSRMQLFTAAGRPEEGVWGLQQEAKGTWSREGSPEVILGHLALDRFFESPKKEKERLKRLQEVMRGGESGVPEMMAFESLLRRSERGREIRYGTTPLKALEELGLRNDLARAYLWEMVRGGELSAKEAYKMGRFRPEERPFLEAAEGKKEGAQLPEEKGMDVYGRRLWGMVEEWKQGSRSGEDLVRQIAERGKARFEPGVAVRGGDSRDWTQAEDPKKGLELIRRIAQVAPPLLSSKDLAKLLLQEYEHYHHTLNRKSKGKEANQTDLEQVTQWFFGGSAKEVYHDLEGYMRKVVKRSERIHLEILGYLLDEWIWREKESPIVGRIPLERLTDLSTTLATRSARDEVTWEGEAKRNVQGLCASLQALTAFGALTAEDHLEAKKALKQGATCYASWKEGKPKGADEPGVILAKAMLFEDYYRRASVNALEESELKRFKEVGIEPHIWRTALTAIRVAVRKEPKKEDLACHITDEERFALEELFEGRAGDLIGSYRLEDRLQDPRATQQETLLIPETALSMIRDLRYQRNEWKELVNPKDRDLLLNALQRYRKRAEQIGYEPGIARVQVLQGVLLTRKSGKGRATRNQEISKLMGGDNAAWSNKAKELPERLQRWCPQNQGATTRGK